MEAIPRNHQVDAFGRSHFEFGNAVRNFSAGVGLNVVGPHAGCAEDCLGADHEFFAGFFNANSAHPFENPTGFSNLVEIVLMLLIPFALTRTYGILVGDRRQGRAVLAAMVVLSVVCTGALVAFELAGAGSATTGCGRA